MGRAGSREEQKSSPRWAKFSIPASPRWLPRSRLFEDFDSRLRNASAVWVSSPGGSGKTAGVVTYLQAREARVLWFHVDNTDSDPASLFTHLRLLAGLHGGEGANDLPALTPEYLSGLTIFARNFFRALCAVLPRPATLVFDNIQDAPADSRIAELLPLLMEELPEGLRVICISRHDPPASLARLQAHGRLERLDWSDLRLDAHELRFLGSELLGRVPSDALVERVLERTGGWIIAALRLLERGGPDATDSEAPSQLPQGPMLFDYFATEVLAEIPQARRELLRMLALVGVADRVLAEQLTGAPGVCEFLEELVQKNQFMSVRPGASPSYEMHPLFREFMLTEARRSWDLEHWHAVAARAAELLKDAGRVKESATLLVELQAWDELASLVEANAAELLREGQHALLLQWLRSFPQDFLEARPWLMFWDGVGSEPTDLAGARAAYSRAFEAFKREACAAGAYSAWAGYVGSYLYFWADFADLDGWFEEFTQLREHYPELPTPEVQARVVAAMLNALLWRRPESPVLEDWVNQARELMELDIDSAPRILTANLLLFRELWWQGDFQAAGRVVEKVRLLLKDLSVPPLVTLIWKVMESAYLAMVNRSGEAIAVVDEGLAVAERFGVYLMNVTLNLQGVYASLASGDWAGAQRYLEGASAYVNPAAQLDLAHIHHLSAWTAICRGNFPEARHHADDSLVYAERCGATLAPAWARHTLAQIDIIEGEYDRALIHLDAAQDWAASAHGNVVMHHCLLSRALVELEAGNDARALDALREALALGKRMGYSAHPWIGWRRDVMARLYAFALAHDLEADYVRGVIRTRHLRPGPEAVDLEAWPFPIRIYTLGRFSLQVDDQPVQPSSRAQRKPWELLQALIALGGRGVAVSRLAEALWPDAEGDAALRSLNTTLHRTRKLLGSANALMVSQGVVTLDSRHCWVDVWALERLLGQVDKIEQTGLAPLAEKLLRLYQGHFLGREADPAWSLSMRERLRTRVVRGLLRVGERLAESGHTATALRVFEHGAELDPLAESLHRPLIACYALLGRRAEALSAYARLRAALVEHLAIEPSAETEDLVEAIRRGDADVDSRLRRYASCTAGR